MVPKRLRAAREAAGLTQEKLAELIGLEGVSLNSRLSNYEAGRFTPTFDFVVRVAKALNCPEGYFYTIDDDFAEFILNAHRKNDILNEPPFNQQDNVKKYKALLEETTKVIDRLHENLHKKI